MRWPWQRKAERRNYTDSITAAFQVAAEGGTSTAPLATAALESASGLYGRCMAAATVRNADPDIVESLSPEVLSQVARELIRKGESTWLIRTPAGRVSLDPVAYATLTGGSPDPMSWRYMCHLYGPTDSMNVSRGASGVLHVRLAFDSARPWQGVAPWAWASSTGRAITNLEKLVADEAGAPFGYLLSVPAAPSEDDDPTAGLRADLAKAKGSTLVIESPESWDTDLPAARGGQAGRFAVTRFGANPPNNIDVLRTETGRDVLSACGVPPTLFVASSDGTAQRGGVPPLHAFEPPPRRAAYRGGGASEARLPGACAGSERAMGGRRGRPGAIFRSARQGGRSSGGRGGEHRRPIDAARPGAGPATGSEPMNHHGELDESASACMENLREIFAEAGQEFDPGAVMSKAVRFFHAACTGGLTVTPSDELRQMAEAEGLGDVPPTLKLH